MARGRPAAACLSLAKTPSGLDWPAKAAKLTRKDLFLSLFVHVVASPFKLQDRLEAEIVLLRHRSNMLRWKSPSKPRLTVTDRRLFVVSQRR
ncbi:MAG: hypothetical protein WCP68_00905 [Enhydrobacter sp.]